MGIRAGLVLLVAIMAATAAAMATMSSLQALTAAGYDRIGSTFPSSVYFRRAKPAVAVSSIGSARIEALSWEEDTFSKYSGYIAEAGSSELKEYDPEQIAIVYKSRPLLLLRRLSQIALKIGGWLVLRYADSLLGQSNTLFKKRVAELREALVELGPAFVKIAQAVSSRPDVIPPAYIEELSLLQDRIAPFSTSVALAIIEAELGVPVEILFSDISPEPVAAASLGQVYQARLRPNGEAVAVKVQRPGVREAIALDMFVLRILAGYAKAVGRLNTDLQAVVDEWASSLFREIDYEAEAQNGVKFGRLFGKLSNVKIPKMYTELTSQRVLIMEWIEGEKLAETKDLRLVEVGTYCSLSQVLDTGFYHADPHPGNLLCTTDGKLAYLDFGMMGEIKQNLRDAIIKASLHLVNREFGALAGDFVDLGLLPPTAPSADVSVALTGVFENAVSRGVSNLSFGDLSGNLGRTMYNFKFRIPSYFSLVIRSLTVLEGIAISIDPKYKVLGQSYPWIARKVLTDTSPTLRSTLYSLLYKDGTFQIDRLESLITESTNSTRAALVLDEGKDYRSSTAKIILSFMLSDQGEYVREILLDELVKGIDALNRSTTETITSNLPPGLSLQGRLLEPEDIQNLNTVRRIIALISATSGDIPSTEVGGSMEIVSRNTWNDILSLLSGSWLSVIPELPFPLQRKLFTLPVDLTGKLISRAIARIIRRSTLESAGRWYVCLLGILSRGPNSGACRCAWIFPIPKYIVLQHGFLIKLH